MTNPVVSVLILTWNRKADLARAIRSVEQQTFQDIEIIVVDSASTDGTPEMLAEEFPQVQCIRLPYNMGVTGGRNMGIAGCSAELIYFLDDDAIFADEFVLEHIVEKFQQQPDMWALVCRLLDINGDIDRHNVRGVDRPSDTDEVVVYNFLGGASCLRKTGI